MGCVTSGRNNVAIGFLAGDHIRSKSCNVFLGSSAGSYSYGNENVYIGLEAGKAPNSNLDDNTGSRNAFVGYGAGYLTTAGSCNVAMGLWSSTVLTTGCHNTTLGMYAGRNITTGSSNVAIGCCVCVASATGNCQLAIGNGSNNWISGDSSWNIRPGAGILDHTGNVGTAASVLTSTGSGVAWEAIPTPTDSTNAAHVLVTDNESTDEDNLITFVENATDSTGNVGLEMDGNLTYNPSTGRLTATQLAGTLTTAAQTNITSVGTLSSVDIDGGAIDGAVIGANSAAAITGTTITANTSIIPDAVGGADIGSTSAEWGDVFIADDKAIKFGNGQDATIEYDENGTDQLRIAGSGVVIENSVEIADSKFIEFASTAGTPGSNDGAQGVVIEFLAAESLTQWDAVYASTTTGRVGRADANDAAKMPVIGVAIEAQGTAGNSVRVLTHGVFRDDGGFGGNMTPGNDVFAPETPGTLQASIPADADDFVQVVGVAIGVRTAFINPDLTIIERAA